MPPINADIISQLPWLAFAGMLAPPYDLITVKFSNSLAERAIPYVPSAVHDDLGRKPFKLSAKLYFCNNLGVGPPTGERYFPEYFDRWLPFLVVGAQQPLLHPILGTVPARVESVDIDLKSTVRSGAIATVNWTDTVLDPATANQLGYTNLALPTQTMAQAADAAADEYGIVYASGPSLMTAVQQFGIVLSIGQTSIGITDVLNAISSLLTIGSIAADTLLAAFQGGVSAMVAQFVALNSPLVWWVIDLLVGFWVALDNKRRQLAVNARPTKVFVTPKRMTIDSVARATGNQITDVIQLNVALLFHPSIDRGKPVTVYVQGSPST